MLVRDFVREIDHLAPFALAESWDHVGLQVGALDARVERALVALDANETAISEAAAQGCQVLLAHHALLFQPLEAVTDASYPGRAALRAVREGVAVVAAHTNLDKARGGLADVVCGVLDLEDMKPLVPASVEVDKLVGFVPEGDLEAVRSAIFAAGAGVIGDYIHCSFAVSGESSFLPREGAQPTVGSVGQDQRTGEVRIEAIFPRAQRGAVVDAYVAAHSYEEPAFDVYQLENQATREGLGRVGYLPEATTLGALARRVAGMLSLKAVRFTGEAGRRVSRVVVVPGAGGSLIEQAASAGDVFITGDVDYHEADEACRLGLSLIEAPHETVEEYALERWCERFADGLARQGVEVRFHAQRRRLWSQTDEIGEAETVATSGEGTALTRAVASEDERYELYVDGGARGNPGPAGIGVRLLDPNGEPVEELSDYIGKATNNVAEYQALVAGLELAVDRGVRKLTVLSDSELVVRQILGQYKVRDAVLRQYHEQAKRLLHQFQEVEVKHILREENAGADSLVNAAIDRATK